MIPLNEKAVKVLEKLIALTDGNGYAKIDNSGGVYMPLTVEVLNANSISLCHYGEQNGDLMRDPEMVFHKSEGYWVPIYYRNDYAGIEEFSCHIDKGQIIVDNEKQQRSQSELSQVWLLTIEYQQNL